MKSLTRVAVWASWMGMCVAALAAPNEASVVKAGDFQQTFRAMPDHQRMVPGASTTYLINTFNSDPNRLYDPNTGGSISGPDTDYGVNVHWAAAFNNDKGYVVYAKTITLALLHFAGKNAVVVTLNKDANGMPGAVIKRALLQSLPSSSPDCCATVSITSPGLGIPLEPNARYWIVVNTTKSGTDTDVVWKNNNAGIEGLIARSYYGIDVFMATTFAFSVAAGK